MSIENKIKQKRKNIANKNIEREKSKRRRRRRQHKEIENIISKTKNSNNQIEFINSDNDKAKEKFSDEKTNNSFDKETALIVDEKTPNEIIHESVIKQKNYNNELSFEQCFEALILDNLGDTMSELVVRQIAKILARSTPNERSKIISALAIQEKAITNIIKIAKVKKTHDMNTHALFIFATMSREGGLSIGEVFIKTGIINFLAVTLNDSYKTLLSEIAKEKEKLPHPKMVQTINAKNILNSITPISTGHNNHAESGLTVEEEIDNQLLKELGELQDGQLDIDVNSLPPFEYYEQILNSSNNDNYSHLTNIIKENENESELTYTNKSIAYNNSKGIINSFSKNNLTMENESGQNEEYNFAQLENDLSNLVLINNEDCNGNNRINNNDNYCEEYLNELDNLNDESDCVTSIIANNDNKETNIINKENIEQSSSDSFEVDESKVTKVKFNNHDEIDQLKGTLSEIKKRKKMKKHASFANNIMFSNNEVEIQSIANVPFITNTQKDNEKDIFKIKKIKYILNEETNSTQLNSNSKVVLPASAIIKSENGYEIKNSTHLVSQNISDFEATMQHARKIKSLRNDIIRCLLVCRYLLVGDENGEICDVMEQYGIIWVAMDISQLDDYSTSQLLFSQIVSGNDSSSSISTITNSSVANNDNALSTTSPLLQNSLCFSIMSKSVRSFSAKENDDELDIFKSEELDLGAQNKTEKVNNNTKTILMPRMRREAILLICTTLTLPNWSVRNIMLEDGVLGILCSIVEENRNLFIGFDYDSLKCSNCSSGKKLHKHSSSSFTNDNIISYNNDNENENDYTDNDLALSDIHNKKKKEKLIINNKIKTKLKGEETITIYIIEEILNTIKLLLTKEEFSEIEGITNTLTEIDFIDNILKLQKGEAYKIFKTIQIDVIAKEIIQLYNHIYQTNNVGVIDGSQEHIEDSFNSD